MHEHGLMKNLMHRVLETAEAEQAKKVTKVSVWLGALSHMSPDHFAEHYEDAARGTIAEGAALDCQTSSDIHDPRANDVVLTGVEVDA